MVDVDKLIRDLQDKDYEPHSFTDDQKLSSAIMDAQALEIRRLQEVVEEVVAEKAALISQLFQAKKKLRKISDADSMKDFRTAISEAEAFLAVMDRAHYDNQF